MAPKIPPPKLGPDEVWQSVALEERLQLVSRSQASGIIASLTSMIVVGCIAYGLDHISLLFLSVASAFFAFPIFSSQVWRTGKPSLILAYLAVRTVARRYAYASDLPNLDITLIFKGQVREIFDDENFARSGVDVNTALLNYKDVWVVLMRSGILFLSERSGGAKLEFITPILPESFIEESPEFASYGERSCTIHGTGIAKGRKVLLTTRFKAAHYVFEKQVQELIVEANKVKSSMEKLRKAS